MGNETLKDMRKASKALTALVEAWSELSSAMENPIVSDIMEKDYPFKESFDEIYFDIANWNMTVGTEIDIRVGVEEVARQIKSMGLSDNDNAEIVNRLKVRFETGF